LGIAPAGSAEEAFANIPSDPRVGGLSQPDGNDDDKMYTHFKPRKGVTANIRSNRMDSFRLKEHMRLYSKLLERRVINPKSVDFDFLDSLNVKLREKFTLLQLERFCSETIEAHAKLTAYFYSNLSFLDANRFSFSVQDQNYVVDIDTLAYVIGVERGKFQLINVSIGRATVELVRDGMVKG